MRGFEIRSKSKEGNICLKEDLNANRNVFHMITKEDDPFLVMSFMFRNNPQGIMMRKMFNIIAEKEAINHINNKFVELGAKPRQDFEVTIIQ